MASEGEVEIPIKAAESLKYKMKIRAQQKCKQGFETYAACTRGRSFSIVWACRDQMWELNDCLAQHTTPEVLNKYKRMWVDAGCPAENFDPEF